MADLTLRNGAKLHLVGDKDATFIGSDGAYTAVAVNLPPAEEIVRRFIEGLRRWKQDNRTPPAPLWSRVSQHTAHSAYSTAICTAYGFNPDEIWRPDNG